MFTPQNIKISRPLGILIAILVAVVLYGAILMWQHGWGGKDLILHFGSQPASNKSVGSKVVKSSSISHPRQVFDYPYPVSWEEQGARFSLTGVSLGQRSASGLFNTVTGDYYKSGETIYALTLYLKIKTVREGDISLQVRRAINEEGDLVPPNNRQFFFPGSGGTMAIGNSTFLDQQVVFTVLESEKEFIINTGKYSNIFFTVTVLKDGSLSVSKD